MPTYFAILAVVLFLVAAYLSDRLPEKLIAVGLAALALASLIR